MPNGPPLEVKVWGSLACFTRPEMKAERVSYSVMTPSAARGVLEAIFWKPEFSWQVREIWVLQPIQHFSIVRNEVNRFFKQKSRQLGSSGVAEAESLDQVAAPAEDSLWAAEFHARLLSCTLKTSGTDSIRNAKAVSELPGQFAPPWTTERLLLRAS